MDVATSTNNVPIRLTAERWHHISVGHPEVAEYYFEILETIQFPDAVYEVKFNELLAIKAFPKLNDKFVVVVYKKVSSFDGFVITSYLTNKIKEFLNRKKIWASQN
ncbi:MAG: hypothetical protein ACK4K9_04425 [Bacteroidia bacterium]